MSDYTEDYDGKGTQYTPANEHVNVKYYIRDGLVVTKFLALIHKHPNGVDWTILHHGSPYPCSQTQFDRVLEYMVSSGLVTCNDGMYIVI